MNNLLPLSWKCFATGLAAISVVPAFAQAGVEPVTLPPVEVVGVTILPSLGTPLNQVPSNIQTLGPRDFDSCRASNVSDALNRSAGSVDIKTTHPATHFSMT